MNEHSVQPVWNAPSHVQVHCSTRLGGCSAAPFDSMNLGLHVDDERTSVLHNRSCIESVLSMPSAPVWMQQVHGVELAHIDESLSQDVICADAATTVTPNRVITVMTADCLPVVFTNSDGSRVAVAHAGWRGLAAGVLQRAMGSFDVDDHLYAWLGPAIGPQSFEVGTDVYAAFVDADKEHAKAFSPVAPKSPAEQKYLANIYALAHRILVTERSVDVSGGEYCTYQDKHRFYSHRRDQLSSGRMATFAWIATDGT